MSCANVTTKYSLKITIIKGIKMKSKLLLLVLLFNLAACSAKLTESGFIVQDSKQLPYSSQQWHDWQLKYETQKLKPITVTVAEPSGEIVTLHGIFIDQPNSDELIYFIQGNGMTVESSMKSVMASLIKLDKDIVIFDRRGTGASNGRATINNLISDANAQFDFIEQSYSPNKIIIHGFSLGSFIAGQVAKNKKIDGLVLQGSATNVDEWIDARMPWYSKIFVTIDVEQAFYQVDNKAVLANDYSNPLLIIAGENDQQAPAILSQRLFDASQSENKALHVVDDATHGNMLAERQEIRVYKEFLASL